MEHNFFDNPLKKPENIALKNIIERDFYNREAEKASLSFPKEYILKIISEYEEDYFKSQKTGRLYDRYHYFFNLLGDVRDKKILELGSGYGYMSVFFAKMGAEVVSADVSEKMLLYGKKVSAIFNLQDKVTPVSTSAENLSFKDCSFDIVICFASLHHFQFDTAIREIQRVLKQGGSACFIDPLANSKLLYNLRKIIPVKNLESPGGGGLKYSDLIKFNDLYSNVHYKEFEFLTRLTRIIRSEKAITFLRKTDYYLLENIRFLKKYARGVVIKVTK